MRSICNILFQNFGFVVFDSPGPVQHILSSKVSRHLILTSLMWSLFSTDASRIWCVEWAGRWERLRYCFSFQRYFRCLQDRQGPSSTISKDFFETLGGIVIFHIYPPGIGELKFVLLTQMAVMTIYGKSHLKILCRR